VGESSQRAKGTPYAEFLKNLEASGLVSREGLDQGLHASAGSDARDDGAALARHLIETGLLTEFQARAIREAKFDELLIGNYEVLDRLGAGGMGTVFKARHRRMKRIVALKVLARNVAETPTFVQRFQREVETVASLSDPHIVMAFDADEAEIGHFLVMEFVDGRDLATEIGTQGPMPVAEAVDCIVQAARGLAYAHAKGFMHRDIKPANLLRDRSGMIKVADLGLARLNAAGKSGEQQSSLTQAGGILGTIDYMSPEQAVDSTTVDHRTDIYSLGCTLHFLLTGKPPYQAATLMAAMLKHRDAPIPRLQAERAEVPAELDSAFARMVAKNPSDRFASMTEVIQALEPLLRVGGSASVAIQADSTMAWDNRVVAPNHDTAESAEQLARTLELPPSRDKLGPVGGILLVEPSRAQSLIIRKYAKELGAANLTTAATGKEALERAQSTHPQTVVCAMHLPDMTGVELARQLWANKDLESTGFVLIASASDTPSSSAAAHMARIVTLSKPFDLDGLQKALEAAGAILSVSGAPAGDLKTLLVDDSAAARSHIRNVLTRLGIRHIVEVGDGASAIAELTRQSFDLVVTDYNMPRLDGRGFLDFIRTQSATPQVPVIMVTTETDPAKLESVRRLGIAGIVDKRFDQDTVRGILEKVRARRS
jgi:serine/threonine protein kinase